MNKTNNYKLNLPSGSDVIDIGVLDENFEKIDNSLTGLDSKIRSNLDLILQVIEKVTVKVDILKSRIGNDDTQEYTYYVDINGATGIWSSGKEFAYKIERKSTSDLGAGLSMYLYAYLDGSTVVVGVDNDTPSNAVFSTKVFNTETITLDLAKLKNA